MITVIMAYEKSTKNTHRFKAAFKAGRSTPTTYRFTIARKKLALTGPFGGPVTATVSQDYDIDRSGTLTACKSTPTKLTCKAL